MGTRNLTTIVLDGQYRIAQYGQWDGYPSGQGSTVLEFLNGMDREKFEKNLRGCYFFTKENLAELQKEGESIGWDAFWEKYHSMSRDRGAEILQIVQDSEGGIGLKNQLAFAGDSLFCEWAYVIDLDTDRLEVFRGFNQSPLKDGERFKDVPDLEVQEGYYPITLAASYPLDSLPSVEQMEIDTQTQEEKEEAETEA